MRPARNPSHFFCSARYPEPDAALRGNPSQELFCGVLAAKNCSAWYSTPRKELRVLFPPAVSHRHPQDRCADAAGAPGTNGDTCAGLGAARSPVSLGSFFSQQAAHVFSTGEPGRIELACPSGCAPEGWRGGATGGVWTPVLGQRPPVAQRLTACVTTPDGWDCQQVSELATTINCQCRLIANGAEMRKSMQ